MKKTIYTVIIIISLILSGCNKSTVELNGDSYSISTPSQTNETTVLSSSVEPISTSTLFTSIQTIESTLEQEFTNTSNEWAEAIINEIISAFKNKDTEYLSQVFKDKSGNAFKFINNLTFSEFEQIGKEEDGNNGIIYYLNISVENGTDDIFTVGGREWEIHIGYGADGNIFQFSPKGKKIHKRAYLENDTVMLCYMFSRNMQAFETMTDFNLLKNNFTHEYLFYLRLLGVLGNWDDGSSYEYDEFSKKVYNLCGVTVNRDIFTLNGKQNHIKCTEEVFDENGTSYDSWYINLDGKTINTWDFMLPSFWYYTELVEYSENEDKDKGTVTINYYGDMAYMFVAKTMKYYLEFNDEGIKIMAIECIYSDDNLVMAFGLT